MIGESENVINNLILPLGRNDLFPASLCDMWIIGEKNMILAMAAEKSWPKHVKNEQHIASEKT